MSFQYRYIDQKGKKRTASLEAASFSDAKEKLRAQNTLFFALEKKRNKRWTRTQDQLRKENLITFTTQLSHLIAAGVPLYESLLSLEEQYRHESFHPILLTLCDQIKEGSSLSVAMSRFPHSFNRLYCAMVAAGESVGMLDQTLEKLATLLSKQNKLKKQITTALIYPTLLFGFSLIVIALLLIFVIPSLETLFEDRDVNRFTKSVMFMSHVLTRGWMFYLPLLVGLGIGCYYAFTRTQWVQKLLLRLPIFKTLIVEAGMARFTRTMGTLLQGGVSIIQALQISRKVIRNPFLEEVIEEAETKIVAGSLLSHELKKSSLIPPLVPRMLAIGEEGGNAPTMLNKIANFYEDEVEKTLNRITALAQPVILIIMGGIVGLIMLAVLLPLTDVSAFT